MAKGSIIIIIIVAAIFFSSIIGGFFFINWGAIANTPSSDGPIGTHTGPSTPSSDGTSGPSVPSGTSWARGPSVPSGPSVTSPGPSGRPPCASSSNMDLQGTWDDNNSFTSTVTRLLFNGSHPSTQASGTVYRLVKISGSSTWNGIPDPLNYTRTSTTFTIPGLTLTLVDGCLMSSPTINYYRTSTTSPPMGDSSGGPAVFPPLPSTPSTPITHTLSGTYWISNNDNSFEFISTTQLKVWDRTDGTLLRVLQYTRQVDDIFQVDISSITPFQGGSVFTINWSSTPPTLGNGTRSWIKHN